MEANSPKDDFGYWIDTKSRRGFLSSNRAGGQGYDDIYKFLETKTSLRTRIIWKVTDLVTSEFFQGKISLFDNKFNPIGTVNTDAKGNYTFLWNAEKLIM
jgi:hypothetical protein